MLVLSRKPGEQIIIGDNIRITVVSMGPGRVKVGIEAPGTVRVDRAEIHDRKLVEAAATPTAVVESATLHNRITGQLPEESADDLRFRPSKPR